MALDRLKEHNPDFDYELVGWAEIDKYAIQAHDAVYPQWAERNFGDISKIDWEQVPDFDLFTYSSPCQDFSQAGKQAGGTEGSGTRSSLLWECRRAILAKRPKYLLMENVAALVSQKFIRLFNAWQLELESYGYRNTAKVLNAKDYGVPQNRERIFMVSVLDESFRYEFPKPMPLTLRLKDVLEKEVAERYYLSQQAVEGFKLNDKESEGAVKVVGELQADNRWGKCIRQQNFVIGTDGVSMSITAKHLMHEFKVAEPVVLPLKGKNKKVQQIIDEQSDKFEDGAFLDCYNQQVNQDMAGTITCGIDFRNQGFVVAKEPIIYDDYNQRIREDQDTCGTLTTNCGNDAPRNGFKVIEPTIIQQVGDRGNSYWSEKDIAFTIPANPMSDRQQLVKECSYRIRKLTERECFRLMDMPEHYIDRIQEAGISRSQQYKMAGNSIVVACLYYIFDRLFINTTPTELTLF